METRGLKSFYFSQAISIRRPKTESVSSFLFGREGCSPCFFLIIIIILILCREDCTVEIRWLWNTLQKGGML